MSVSSKSTCKVRSALAATFIYSVALGGRTELNGSSSASNMVFGLKLKALTESALREQRLENQALNEFLKKKQQVNFPLSQSEFASILAKAEMPPREATEIKSAHVPVLHDAGAPSVDQDPYGLDEELHQWTLQHRAREQRLRQRLQRLDAQRREERRADHQAYQRHVRNKRLATRHAEIYRDLLESDKQNHRSSEELKASLAWDIVNREEKERDIDAKLLLNNEEFDAYKKAARKEAIRVAEEKSKIDSDTEKTLTDSERGSESSLSELNGSDEDEESDFWI